jgi:hypothetical protein
VLEHAQAVDDLPGAEVLVAWKDAADVLPAQLLRRVAEELPRGAVDDADDAGHVGDDDRAFHRVENLRGREAGGDPFRFEAPDRRGGDDHVDERGEVRSRLQIETGRRQVVEEAERADRRREEQRAAAFAPLAVRIAVRAPEEVDARTHDRGDDREHEYRGRLRARIPAPLELPHAADDDVGGQADDRGGETRGPGDGERDPVAALAGEEARRELKDRGADQDAEGVADARPRQRDHGLEAGVHRRPGGEPAAGDDGEDEEGAAGAARAPAPENARAEEQDGHGRERRRNRQRCRLIGTPRQTCEIGHGVAR